MITDAFQCNRGQAVDTEEVESPLAIGHPTKKCLPHGIAQRWLSRHETMLDDSQEDSRDNA